MDGFSVIIMRLLPLYLIILLGFIVGRFMKIDLQSVARLLIYAIVPVVVFTSVLNTKLTYDVVVLPVVVLILSVILCLVGYFMASMVWKDSHKNILALSAGYANAGYFGLPVAIALFGNEFAGILMVSILGFLVYENSLGFYIAARGNYSASEAFARLLRLPSLYAFFAAIALNLLGFRLSSDYSSFTGFFIGAFSVLGMMMIGLALSNNFLKTFDLKFMLFALFSKFVLWPAAILSIIVLDMAFFNFFSSEVYKVMLLISVVPMAANTVAYAAMFKSYSEKAAFAVLLSTLVALLAIPSFFWLVGLFLAI